MLERVQKSDSGADTGAGTNPPLLPTFEGLSLLTFNFVKAAHRHYADLSVVCPTALHLCLLPPHLQFPVSVCNFVCRTFTTSDKTDNEVNRQTPTKEKNTTTFLGPSLVCSAPPSLMFLVSDTEMLFFRHVPLFCPRPSPLPAI